MIGGNELQLSTKEIVVAGMLGAISIVLGVTRLGFIPVPTPAGNATIMHIPAILGAVLEGPVVGALIGLIFGIFSFLQPGAPMFTDPLIAIVPRIFIGIFAYFAYRSLVKRNESLALITAGIVGTLVNTIFVLGLAVIRDFLPLSAAIGAAWLHGLPEVVLAAVLVSLVGKGVLKYRRSN
ncbi:ECF transporter S component [Halanaerobiaceae bacterium Z-7014]|uniref:ECF transporter S component n=1 Tax=Halonatronomonas betaini TaxID=2778430 RepID=A0A931FA30_9FIRM|nr:ECF transporter S component [Halonatronomonas betaini]